MLGMWGFLYIYYIHIFLEVLSPLIYLIQKIFASFRKCPLKRTLCSEAIPRHAIRNHERRLAWPFQSGNFAFPLTRPL